MFHLAELWGLRPDGSNPRRHIKKYPEEKRERYLSPAELAALSEALSLSEQWASRILTRSRPSGFCSSRGAGSTRS
jgi:hypothetical protein